MRTSLVVTLVSGVVLGCASGGRKTALPERLRLRFGGRVGTETETQYHSHSRTRAFADRQLLRDRSELVDFTVATKVTGLDATTGVVSTLVRTTAKDGPVELHDLAFPEPGEELAYRLKANGEVLQAGTYARQSLFFVPALPMPKGDVAVGDTWALDHEWLSANEGIPLRLEVIGILKGIVSCERGVCADIEVSGRVRVLGRPKHADAEFGSRVWGRVLFSVDRGDVLWSEMRAHEEMGIPGERVAIDSCMASRVISGTKAKLACEPDERAIIKVPQI